METNINYSDIRGRIPKVGDKVVYSRTPYSTALSYVNYGVIREIKITDKSVRIYIGRKVKGHNFYYTTYNDQNKEFEIDELRFPKDHCNYCIIND